MHLGFSSLWRASYWHWLVHEAASSNNGTRKVLISEDGRKTKINPGPMPVIDETPTQELKSESGTHTEWQKKWKTFWERKNPKWFLSIRFCFLLVHVLFRFLSLERVLWMLRRKSSNVLCPCPGHFRPECFPGPVREAKQTKKAKTKTICFPQQRSARLQPFTSSKKISSDSVVQPPFYRREFSKALKPPWEHPTLTSPWSSWMSTTFLDGVCGNCTLDFSKLSNFFALSQQEWEMLCPKKFFLP